MVLEYLEYSAALVLVNGVLLNEGLLVGHFLLSFFSSFR